MGTSKGLIHLFCFAPALMMGRQHHEMVGERQRVPVVSMVHGDILDFGTCDWRDGDILFANSTCFDDAVSRIPITTERRAFTFCCCLCFLGVSTLL